VEVRQIKPFCKDNRLFHVKAEPSSSLVDVVCIRINFILRFTCLLRAERPFESYYENIDLKNG